MLLYAQNAEPPGLKVTMAFVLEPHPFSPVCAPLLKYKKKKEEEKKKKKTPSSHWRISTLIQQSGTSKTLDSDSASVQL